MAPEPPNSFYQMMASLAGNIGRVRTRSVIAPMLAITGTVGFFASVRGWLSPNSWISDSLWVLFFLCVVAAVAAYAHFSWKEPERLQTEEYRLALRRIDVIGDERDPNDMKVINAIPTSNTHAQAPSPLPPSQRMNILPESEASK